MSDLLNPCLLTPLVRASMGSLRERGSGDAPLLSRPSLFGD